MGSEVNFTSVDPDTMSWFESFHQRWFVESFQISVDSNAYRVLR